MVKMPPKLMKSWLRYVVGVFLVIIGSVLFFLPIGPGSLFIFLGLYCINKDWTNRKLKWLKEGSQKKWKRVKLIFNGCKCPHCSREREEHKKKER